MDPRRCGTFVRSLTDRPTCIGPGWANDLICCQCNPGVPGVPGRCAALDARGNSSAKGALHATPVG